MDLEIDFIETYDKDSIIRELQRIAGVLGSRCQYGPLH